MRRMGLVLPGYACTSQIWRLIRPDLDAAYDVTWVDWPPDLTPGFHTPEAFAAWLRRTIRLIDYDFVIGHSLGGLVAIHLAKADRGFMRQVILVESFLAPPSPFFQNLLLETDPTPEARSVREMLDREQANYSPALRAALPQVDLTLLASSLEPKLAAIYGDRASGDSRRVVQELAWPPALQRRVEVSVVPNACHFPMLENAPMTVGLLQDILK